MEKERAVVLIVDDHEELAHTLRMILESKGYKAELAYNGASALNMGTTYPYDAVILDVKLPDVDGTKLIERLLKCNPNLVVIMLTGFPDQRNTMDSMNLGARGYLTKPVDTEKLLEMLEEKLQQQKEANELTQEKIGDFIKTRLEKLKKLDLGEPSSVRYIDGLEAWKD